MSSKIQEKNKKISKEALIEEILKIYPTLKDCADALKMSDSNFSHAISRRSNKFLFTLKNLGINIPSLSAGFYLELTDGQVKENQQLYSTAIDEIKNLKTEITELKKIISLSVNRLTELELENERLRSENAALLNITGGMKGGRKN